jgi:hypothetical protein
MTALAPGGEAESKGAPYLVHALTSSESPVRRSFTRGWAGSRRRRTQDLSNNALGI